ncbi:hypothetical protein [Burkholderia cenocepacia]|uniref:hypothetical protein n=1 Tax=Burkholderia cenocepacia TaxID=95486 RepID=UPI002230D1FC|nr:hypothetical protein [Burkholderia cenocepacia]MCW3640568.1 hypothetical protein [Burkholderia cenocepacia]
MADPTKTPDPTPAEQLPSSPLAPLLEKLNEAFPDGAAGAADPKASSQGFLRQAAFARESLTRPEDSSED